MEVEREFNPAVNPSFQFPLTVVVHPLPKTPICPGFHSVSTHDPQILADLVKISYIGAFVLKDDTSINELKGKALLHQLYEIGSLARILSIQDHQAIVMTGLTRIRIIEMVSDDPVLTVKVDCLKDKPYDKDDDAIKATSFEVYSALRDVLNTDWFWTRHVQHLGHYSYSYLADFGAMMHSASRHEAQQVIQELDVHKRLQLTLQLARKEMQIIKIEGFPMEGNYLVLSFPPAPDADETYEQTPIGVAMALSWTSTGGSTSYMETRLVEEGEGIGCLEIMGQVGEETKESARIAYIVAKKILLQKQPENTFFANSKLCLHLRTGRGSSGGCTMLTSFLSLAMNKPVRKNLAMTGVLTLEGKILQIGSVKEKTIAATQSQVKMIIFPEANRRDFNKLKDNVKQGLEAHFVNEYEQIFELAFGYNHYK